MMVCGCGNCTSQPAHKYTDKLTSEGMGGGKRMSCDVLGGVDVGGV